MSTPKRSELFQCAVEPLAFSSSHLSDSGTKRRMKKMSSAGNAPLIIRKRHAELASSLAVVASEQPMALSIPSTPPMKPASPMLRRATSRKPTLAAAPIRPAMNARDLPGQISFTSATPRDHSPPMPSEAMKRSPAMCHASVANPHRPVKMA